MPFDPTTYQPPRLPDPTPRRLSSNAETILLRLIFFWLFLMLILPFSAGSFIDLIHYAER